MSTWTQAWHEIIQGKRSGLVAAVARFGLRLASGPYWFGIVARNALFDRGWKRVHTVPVPVVAIGNLTLGGTGKTPCVEYVAQFYRDRGVQVAILSRGYGSQNGRNDEALVLEHNQPDVPHLQGANRVELAATAIEELEAELLVLDDGFQHRRLHRDLDIVLIDATCPPQHDAMFPRGTLREPVSGLRRASAILLTRCDQVTGQELEALRKWISKRCHERPIALTEHRPIELQGMPGTSEHPGVLAGRPVAGFCGIGNPNAFRRTLEELGASVVSFREFPDHHNYTRADIENLENWANQQSREVIIATTQKDWVKLQIGELGQRPLRAVRIGLAFREGQQAFDELLGRLAPPVS